MPDQTPEPDVTVTSQSITLHVPGLPDVPNRYGSGTIRPMDLHLTYRRDRVTARLEGRWRRPDRESTDAYIDQLYKDDPADWPDWIADYARQHAPTGPHPTGRAALRDRIAEALAREDAHNAGYDHGFVGQYGVDAETDGFVDAVLAALTEAAAAAGQVETQGVEQ